jgi:hypothetical protein
LIEGAGYTDSMVIALAYRYIFKTRKVIFISDDVLESTHFFNPQIKKSSLWYPIDRANPISGKRG